MRKLLLALLFVSPLVFAVGEKTFIWDPPTQNEDGTPLTQDEIASYDIECDGFLLVNVPNNPVNTDRFETAPGTFAVGEHSCVAFTNTTNGRRSVPSNTEVFIVAALEPGVPMPPTNFAVQ